MERFEAPDSSSSDEPNDSTESESGSDYSSSQHSETQIKKRKRSSSGSESEDATRVSSGPGLALSQLYMMTGEDGGEDKSSYAKSGKDPVRIKNALKQPCCQSRCKRLLPVRLVMHMVAFFWSMPKGSQDCVLWAMQQRERQDFKFTEGDDGESSSSSTHHQISWSIEGLFLL